MNNNRNEFLRDRLDEATERLRNAVRNERDRYKPIFVVTPKGKTMYTIRRRDDDR